MIREAIDSIDLRNRCAKKVAIRVNRMRPAPQGCARLAMLAIGPAIGLARGTLGICQLVSHWSIINDRVR